MKTSKPSISEITFGTFRSLLQLIPLGGSDHELRVEIVNELKSTDQNRPVAHTTDDNRHLVLMGITLLGNTVQA